MILCAGEALIDMLPEGENFKPVPGGAALNASLALARMGQNVSLATGMSTNPFGQRLLALMDQEGIGRNWLQMRDLPATLAFVTLENGDANYMFYDENSAGRHVRAWNIPYLPAAALFGGISLAIAPGAEPFEALYENLATHNVALMLDLNIRPAAIADEDAYRARLARMMTNATIIKASDEDLDWLQCDAKALKEHGAKLVCHTKGADGVEAHFKTDILTCPAPKAEVVDTVGAGDTFNAALLTHLIEHDRLNIEAIANISETHLDDALQFATRAASMSVTRAGANPPRRSEL